MGGAFLPGRVRTPGLLVALKHGLEAWPLKCRSMGLGLSRAQWDRCSLCSPEAYVLVAVE